MMRPRRQTILDPKTGDCFRTAVAMVLDLDPETMPNFCAHGDTWWTVFQDWLAEHHRLFAIDIRLDGGKVPAYPFPVGVPVVVTGDSPNFPGNLHSVAGFTAADGFELAYDPNPSDRMLADVQYVTFFAPLRPDRITRKTDDHRAAAV